MCDCLKFINLFNIIIDERKNWTNDENFEISVTSIDLPGDGQINLSNKNKIYDEIMFYYTKMVDNEDYNLLVPIEGNPNDIINDEYPKLLSNIRFGETLLTKEMMKDNIFKNKIIEDKKKQECINGLLGDWSLIDELSDDMDLLLQKLGIGLLKRRVINKGNFTLKVIQENKDQIIIKIEPFFGPTQIMNWDLSGNIFIEDNREVGRWENKVEFIKFKHERTDNKEILALNMIRKNNNISGTIIETRWSQKNIEYSRVKYIRYRYINENNKCIMDIFRAFKPK